MSDASWELQQQIFTLLKAGNAVASGRIYDDVPDAAASASAPDSEFPYVVIGEMDSIPDDADGAAGRDDGEMETLTLHIWSRYQGQKEVKQIMQQIKDLLHNTTITYSGRTANLWVRARRSFLDPDGRTRHGVVSIEAIHRS